MVRKIGLQLELANLNPSRTPKGKKHGDVLDFIYQSLKEQELQHVLLWLTFGDGDGSVYIAREFLKKITKEEIVNSIGYIDERDNIHFDLQSLEKVSGSNAQLYQT